jgi:hypothetical protein
MPRLMVQRTTPLLALLLAAALVAGCGSSKKSNTTSSSTSTPTTAAVAPSPAPLTAAQYKAKLAEFSKREDKVHGLVDKVMGAKHKTVLAIRIALTVFANDQQAFGDQVAAITPPKDATAANALLARGAHDTASELRPLLAKLAKVKSVKAALALIGGSPPKGGAEVDRALGKLKKLGYTKGS